MDRRDADNDLETHTMDIAFTLGWRTGTGAARQCNALLNLAPRVGPFFGGVLAFTITQPVGFIIAVFLAVGVGLAFVWRAAAVHHRKKPRDVKPAMTTMTTRFLAI